MGDTLAPNPDNYLKGGAVIMFKRDTQAGYTDIGNIPDFSFSLSATYIEHKTSRSGILILDRKEQSEAGLTFKIGEDEFNAANLALICNANAPSAFSQALATGNSMTITSPVLGDKYDLGAFRITNLVVKRSGNITLTAGTDYSAELDLGMLRALPGGAVQMSDTLMVTFDKPALVGNTVSPLSKTGLLKGEIMIFVRCSDGRLFRFYHTKASLAYEGEIAIGGTEFSKASGTITVEADYSQTDVYGKWVLLPAA